MQLLAAFDIFKEREYPYNDISFVLGQDVKWLQTITRMPILVKGVMTAEDSKHLNVVFSLEIF